MTDPEPVKARNKPYFLVELRLSPLGLKVRGIEAKRTLRRKMTAALRQEK